MIDAELLKLLRCPETRQPLTPDAAGLLARLSGRIATGKLRNCGGQALQEKLPAGLVRGAVLFARVCVVWVAQAAHRGSTRTIPRRPGAVSRQACSVAAASEPFAKPRNLPLPLRPISNAWP